MIRIFTPKVSYSKAHLPRNEGKTKILYPKVIEIIDDKKFLCILCANYFKAIFFVKHQKENGITTNRVNRRRMIMKIIPRLTVRRENSVKLTKETENNFVRNNPLKVIGCEENRCSPKFRNMKRLFESNGEEDMRL